VTATFTETINDANPATDKFNQMLVSIHHGEPARRQQSG